MRIIAILFIGVLGFFLLLFLCSFYLLLLSPFVIYFVYGFLSFLPFILHTYLIDLTRLYSHVTPHPEKISGEKSQLLSVAMDIKFGG